MDINQTQIEQWQIAMESSDASSERIQQIVSALDAGVIRVAEYLDGEWVVHEWIKRAVMQYFGIRTMEESRCGVLSFRDKIPVKSDFTNVRVVPGGSSVRYGAHIEEQVVIMPPSYVNIGARIGARSMIDSNVLVGSCAQIGAGVHLSAGVQIGGVLEPVNARPVIIEEGVFVGAGAIIVEGLLIQKNALIAPGVVLSAGTKILEVDPQGAVVKTWNKSIPPGAIVVPGARKRGEILLQTPIIIGYRDQKTDAKVALNQYLRNF